MYKKRRRSSWPSQLLAVGLLLGGSCWITAPAFADDCGDPGSPISVTDSSNFSKLCAIETGSDEDWFTFTAQAGYSYTIKADQVGADIDVALELRGPDDNAKVQASQNRGFEGEPETLDYTATAAGSVWIRVFHTGFFGSNTAYQLSITGEAPKVEPQLEIKSEVTQPLHVTAGTDSQQAIVFQVIDKNNNGQPVSGQTIQFSLLNSEGAVVTRSTLTTTPNPPTTTADGNVSLVLTTPTKTGEYKIKAEISDSKATPAEVMVTVVPGVPAKLKLTKNGNGCETSPSVGTSCTMTFELMDAYENKITDKTPNFTVTPPTDSKVKTCVVSIENEQVKCVLTPDAAGSYTIASATVDNTAIPFDPAPLPVVQVNAAPSTFVLAPKEDTMPPATVETAYTVTFKLTENGSPKGGEKVHFEMTEKPQNSTSQLETAVDKPTDATAGEVSISFTPDLAGKYVITASLTSVSSVTGKAEVTASVGEQPTPTLTITPCQTPSVGTPCQFTFTLTNGDTSAKTINVSWTKPGSGNPEKLSDVTMTAGANSGNTDLTFDLEGQYSITATLATDDKVTGSTSVTVSAASPPPPTYSLTVVGGGNQSVVQEHKSLPITFQVQETGTNTPVPDEKIEIALTVPDDQTLLVNVALSPPVLPLPSPTTVIQTNSQGEATVEVSFEKKTGMIGVTTYLLSAKLKDNPGVTDYTNVFLLEKPLEELLTPATTPWPILQEVNDDGTLKTDGTGVGSAVDKEGKPLSTTTIFHGGLNDLQQAKVGLTDTVTVQGVIGVDDQDKDKVADIVVFGANDSSDEIKADGCYMLGSSFPVNILSLSSDKACQLGKDKDEVSKLVPFRRGVTLAKEMLVEMYTGNFVYPATSLKIYFGYRLEDGTLVYNGSNPIYITIEEKSPVAPADGSVTEGKTDTETSPTPPPGKDTATTPPPASDSSGGEGSTGTPTETATVPDTGV